MKSTGNKQRVFAALIGIGLLALLPACNLGSQLDSTVLVSAAVGGSVTSSDGQVTLDIPAGALSQDVEISIAQVSQDKAPEELIALAEEYGGLLPDSPAYRLEPDGLEFDEPVTISFDAPDAIKDNSVEGFALLTQGSGGEPEWLDDLEITADLDEGTVVISGKLTHFSWVVRTKTFLKASLEQVKPKEQTVGVNFICEDSKACIGMKLENTANSPIYHTQIRIYLDTSGPVTANIHNNPFYIFRPFSNVKYFSGDPHLDSGDVIEDTVILKCTAPGIGSYSLSIDAIAVKIPNDPPFKRFNMTISASVRCVGSTPTPTPVPTATPTPVPTATPTPDSTQNDEEEHSFNYFPADPDGALFLGTDILSGDREATFVGADIARTSDGLIVKVYMLDPLITPYSFAVIMSILSGDLQLAYMWELHVGELKAGQINPQTGELIPEQNGAVKISHDIPNGIIVFEIPLEELLIGLLPINLRSFHSPGAGSDVSSDSFLIRYQNTVEPAITFGINSNLREGPGIDYEVIWTFEKGAATTIVGRYDSTGWILVRINDPDKTRKQCGWVFAELLGYDVSSLPVINSLPDVYDCP